MSEVTRDFDAERRERYPEPVTFRMRDEVFTVIQGISPEEYGAKAQPFFSMTRATPNDEALKIADEFVVAFTDGDDSAERWKKVRALRNPAVTVREIFDLCRWIIEEQTGVPTQQPAPSPDGDGSDGELSTEPSSSDPEASAVSAD